MQKRTEGIVQTAEKANSSRVESDGGGKKKVLFVRGKRRLQYSVSKQEKTGQQSRKAKNRW